MVLIEEAEKRIDIMNAFKRGAIHELMKLDSPVVKQRAIELNQFIIQDNHKKEWIEMICKALGGND